MDMEEPTSKPVNDAVSRIIASAYNVDIPKINIPMPRVNVAADLIGLTKVQEAASRSVSKSLNPLFADYFCQPHGIANIAAKMAGGSLVNAKLAELAKTVNTNALLKAGAANQWKAEPIVGPLHGPQTLRIPQPEPAEVEPNVLPQILDVLTEIAKGGKRDRFQGLMIGLSIGVPGLLVGIATLIVTILK